MTAYQKISLPRKFSKCKFIPHRPFSGEKGTPLPCFAHLLVREQILFHPSTQRRMCGLSPGCIQDCIPSFAYSVFLFSVGLYTVFFFSSSSSAEELFKAERINSLADFVDVITYSLTCGETILFRGIKSSSASPFLLSVSKEGMLCASERKEGEAANTGVPAGLNERLVGALISRTTAEQLFHDAIKT